MLTETTPVSAPPYFGGALSAAIADLAVKTAPPSIKTVQTSARRSIVGPKKSHHVRAVQQARSGAIQTYFTRFALTAPWAFAGPRYTLDPATTDLLWADGDRHLLLDILYTGRAALLAASITSSHVDHTLRRAHDVYGTALVGARLLTLAEPGRSLFVSPTRQVAPLANTPYG
jgi:hypothetical protein